MTSPALVMYLLQMLWSLSQDLLATSALCYPAKFDKVKKEEKWQCII